MKKVLAWGLFLFLLGALAGAYFLVPSVRDLVRKATASFREEKGGKFWCPMHPEIVRDRPGTCPN